MKRTRIERAGLRLTRCLFHRALKDSKTKRCAFRNGWVVYRGSRVVTTVWCLGRNRWVRAYGNGPCYLTRDDAALGVKV